MPAGKYPVGSEGKPHQPKRKDFPLANGATKEFDAGEASITLVEEGRRVIWDVPENNHACEYARATFMGKALFEALRSVTWSRGSGGEIIGNDEYNQESRSDGGGSNYTKGYFGPPRAVDKVSAGIGGWRDGKTNSTPRPRW